MLNKSFRLQYTTDNGQKYRFIITPLGIIFYVVVGWWLVRRFRRTRKSA